MTKLFLGRFSIAASILSMVLLLNGCPVVAAKKIVDKHDQSQAAYVKVYKPGEALPTDYKVVGHISTDNKQRFGRAVSQADIYANLQVKAKDVGANGVIVQKVEADKTLGEAIQIPGVANS